MSGFATAICDRDLGGKGAPEWVHLLPSGRIVGRDGRSFDLTDPQTVMAQFEAGRIDLPIDYEHQNDRSKASGPVPAAGWIKELQARKDGLWGRVEWTARAADLIANREYRYLSPSILYNRLDQRIVKLKGAGLVHAPNLHLTALASQEDTMPQDEMTFAQSIAKMLGLPPETPEDEILRALVEHMEATSRDDAQMAQARPDPRRYVPIEALHSLMTDRNAQAATMREARAQSHVDDAFRRDYLTGPMKDWAPELCRMDEASFDAFINTATPYAKGGSILPSGPPRGADAQAKGSPLAEAVCAQLGISIDRLAN
ncbi:phage protease [Roseovarius dicentrarchi]|uniref:phage protease n=1 Tax=Roseovarius dicentrarchi TaxID=2250573 RepID=UPI000DEBD775|nr:phage protease [Roseovarius dicentrarchi]